MANKKLFISIIIVFIFFLINSCTFDSDSSQNFSDTLTNKNQNQKNTTSDDKLSSNKNIDTDTKIDNKQKIKNNIDSIQYKSNFRNINKNQRFTKLLDYIHTGTYFRTIETFNNNHLNNLFQGWELIEYDPPSDGNCWLWASIPVILNQVLDNEKIYQHFIKKLKKFPEYVEKFGEALTNNERKLCDQIILILTKLKNREAKYTELDQNKYFIKFLKSVSKILGNIHKLENLHKNLLEVKDKLQNLQYPKFLVSKVEELLKHKTLFKRENIKKLDSKLDLLVKKFTKYLNILFYIFEDEDPDDDDDDDDDKDAINNEINKIFKSTNQETRKEFYEGFYNDIEELQFKIRYTPNESDPADIEQLNEMKIDSWGNPRYLLYLLSYFNLNIFNILNNENFIKLHSNYLTINSNDITFRRHWNKFLQNSKSLKIIMNYINENHSRYIVLRKK